MMKPDTILTGAISAAILVSGLIGAGAAQERNSSKAVSSTPMDPIKIAAASGMPTYTPPKRGAPGGRIGGGSRGVQRDVFSLSVLAPDHTGLTTNPQPRLYWFVSSDLASTSAELTLIDPEGTQPLLETKLSPPVKTGVHMLNLADHGVKLSPGIPYRWYVALVVDPERRSKDILAGGFVELVPAPEGLAAKLSSAQKAELPNIYAEAGLWYDAIAAASELVDAAPGDTSARQQRAALLEQAGLTDVANLLK